MGISSFHVKVPSHNYVSNSVLINLLHLDTSFNFNYVHIDKLLKLMVAIIAIMLSRMNLRVYYLKIHKLYVYIKFTFTH